MFKDNNIDHLERNKDSSYMVKFGFLLSFFCNLNSGAAAV